MDDVARGVVPALKIKLDYHRYADYFTCHERICLDCGEIAQATTDHTFDVAYSCVDRTCKDCGYVQPSDNNHTFEQAYSCVDRTCLGCGFVDVGDNNHRYADEFTCHNRYCLDCGFIQVATTEHTFENSYTCANRTCTDCGFVQVGDSNHRYVDNYTCHDRSCLDCGTILAATTEHTLQKGTCSVCGEKTFEREGDTIYFGSYPQTIVTDTTITNALGGFDESTWLSYGYYINGSVQNYMYYIDKEYNGEKYRGVYFTSYRPYVTTSSSSTNYSHQDDNGYNTSTVYWFKYQPIKWTIVAESNGYATLVADLILDSQEYYISDTSSQTTRNDYQGNSASAYANNYQYSIIRSWLNTTFYQTAFNELQQSIIQTVNVDNSVSSTGDSSNSYACSNTNDKVWLLSYQEATTYFGSTSARMKKGTDYAKSQGLYASTNSSYLGNSYWWLRSPYGNDSDGARAVNFGGNVSSYSVFCTNSGVVPALKIKL